MTLSSKETCDRLHCNDTIGRCDDCPMGERREWIGSAGESIGRTSVAVHWPTRETWDRCQSYPVVLVDGKVFKRQEARDLHAHLTRALERVDEVIDSNRLPWEKAA